MKQIYEQQTLMLSRVGGGRGGPSYTNKGDRAAC